MEEQEENMLVTTKRVVKRKVPQDYDPHGGDRKVTRKQKKKRMMLHKNRETDFKCESCGGEHYLKGDTNIRKCRHVFDPESKKTMKLCNACGLKLKRKQTKNVVPVKQVEDSDKEKYLEEGRAFGLNISKLIDDELAKQFFCPKFRGKPCRCLQTFMQSNLNDITEVKKRANLLLRYHKKAKELMDSGAQELKTSRKRSKEYDHFVLTNRDYLKSQLRLCELAVQKVLGYSNNFLYKHTGPEGKRLTTKPTIGAEKSSIRIEDILKQHEGQCKDLTCKKQAMAMLETDLTSWREKSLTGQLGRQAVIQDLARRFSCLLCENLIQLVTGAGISCIRRVARQMRNKEENEQGSALTH